MIALPRRQASSPDLAIEAIGLRKTYRTRRRRQIALDGLNLRVPSQGVHAFLGANGAGKTTTIRMLLGLIKADDGEMSVFGEPVPARLPQVIGRIGAIVEQPSFFPAFSGRKSLRLVARAIGAPRNRVNEVLEVVGLSQRAKDAFRTYSLGMKQRLAIAATLLKNPDLLIFDEPTNGLDPAGISEIREMMRTLARAGKTVLVSSHLLSEVQQVAETVSIIGRGRLLAEGNVSEILAASGIESVRIGVADPVRAADVLVQAGYGVQVDRDQLLVTGSGLSRIDPALLNQLLAEQGLYAYELIRHQANLESVFLDLTAGERVAAKERVSTPALASARHSA